MPSDRITPLSCLAIVTYVKMRGALPILSTWKLVLAFGIASMFISSMNNLSGNFPRYFTRAHPQTCQSREELARLRREREKVHESGKAMSAELDVAMEAFKKAGP